MTCYQIILVSWKIALNGAYQSHMTISYLCAFPSPPSNLEIAFCICLKDACTYTCEHRQLVLLKASRKIFLVAPGGAGKGRGWCEGCECWCEMSVNRVWVVGGSVSTPCLCYFGAAHCTWGQSGTLGLFGCCFCSVIKQKEQRREICQRCWV